MRSRGGASVIAATRVVTTFATRAFVDAAFAGCTRCSTGNVAFGTAFATTTTTTSTATRPASGTLAAIALGTLLLPVTQRRCGGCGVAQIQVARDGCDDRGCGDPLLTRFLRLAVLTRRARFAGLARWARLARRTRLLRLALALLAAYTTRLALARAAFVALTLALALATVTTSATRAFVTSRRRLLLGLRPAGLVAPRFGAAGRLA